IWYKPFFGSDEAVDKFFGVTKSDEHAAILLLGAAHAAEDKPKEEKAKEPAVPGQGAIYRHPDNHVLHDAHYVPTWVKLSPFIVMVIGFLTAFQFYIRRPDIPAKLAAQQRPLYLFLLNKWYVDEIYDFLFVRPSMWLGRFLWKKGDGATIDGFLNGVAMGIVPFFTRLAGRAQSGYIFTYAFTMVLGIALFITWITISGGAE
ncbi:MAG: NADH-quinone oxidoreductase subunit L, partial [Boseongicola sp.]|nr:NADH-quinone oxidoreductase subunit L [Boseongicola sp.]